MSGAGVRSGWHSGRPLSADTESIAALSLWTDAVRARTLDDEIVTDVRRKLETRMWQHRPAKGFAAESPGGSAGRQ